MKLPRLESCFFGAKGLVVFCCWVVMLFPLKSKAQSEEILLTFRYPSVGHFYVNSIHNPHTGTNFLPLIELFNLFEIYFKSIDRSIIQGNFITADKPFAVNLVSRTIVLGTTMVKLSQDDFILSETDLFLCPAVYQEVFGLYFTVNLNHLALDLTTTHIFPVQDRVSREMLRRRIGAQQQARDDFPMRFPIARSVISGAMLDYGLGTTITENNQSLDFNLMGGMEFLGGDLQGSAIGFADNTGNYSFTASNFRWRYAVRDHPLFSNFTAGQISTTGILGQSITGFSISNEPIEPRKMHEYYVFDGTTEPDSEVELFVNDQLTTYMRADELGYYRFEVPLMFGTTRISIRIFTPQGEIRLVEHNIPIPFTFLPPGVFSYNVQGGLLPHDPLTSYSRMVAAHGNIAYGVNRWLTAQVGTHAYGSDFNFDNQIPYGVLSARIAYQYLVSLEAAANEFYRFNTSFISPKNLGFHLQYTIFDGPGIFNAANAEGEVTGSMSLPITLFGTQAGIRLGGEGLLFNQSFSLRYRADLHARLGRVNLRLNYRDNLVNALGATTMGSGTLTTALTYNVSRTPGLPIFVRGMFLRAQGSYDIRRNRWLTSDLQISQTITRNGRLNLGVVYNHENNQLDLRMGFTIDLSKVRSTSTLQRNRTGIMYQQTLTGSVGIDAANRFVNLSNRQQVGYGAISVIQFVDEDGSGTYDPGERLLPYRGVTLDRIGLMSVGRDSILRIGQLQSYHLYNLTVNRNAISDPTLVPGITEFSFVVDPNQHKRIEIPYHQGGTIAGTVSMWQNGQSQGVGGLRVILESAELGFTSVMRTFSDGSFYLMDLPPGMFTLRADSLQLGFLNAMQEHPVQFEIKSTPAGDFVEGLAINLRPIVPDLEVMPDSIADRDIIPTLPQQPPPQVQVIDVPTAIQADIAPLPVAINIADFQNRISEIILQVGAFRFRSYAARHQARIEKLTDLPVFILRENGFSKIIIFGFESIDHALHIQNILTKQEIPSFFRLSTKFSMPKLQPPAPDPKVPTLLKDSIVTPSGAISIAEFQNRIGEIMLQAGAFRVPSNAMRLQVRLQELLNKPVFILKEDSLMKVVIFGFESVEHALNIQRNLTKHEIPSYFRFLGRFTKFKNEEEVLPNDL